MALSRRSRPERTVHVPRTAIGSGARVTDMFPLPPWLWLTVKFFQSLLHHWFICLIVIAFFFLDWRLSLAILLLVPLLVCGYVWAFNRHHGPAAILRAAWRLFRVRRKWKFACKAAELNDDRKCPWLLGIMPHRPPRIMNERGTAIEFLVDVGRVGLIVEHIEQNKDYLAAALAARRVRVNRIRPSLAKVVFEWERSRRSASIKSKMESDVLLPRVELDTDVLLELETSLLIVGLSGTGKSNAAWYILNELNKIEMPYNIYAVDPKKVELAELINSPHIKAYADDIEEIDNVIDRFYDDMMKTYERAKSYTPALRRAPLGPEWPLNLLIIDELLFCEQGRKGVDSNLAKILIGGRAMGFVVIAESQLSQVDALSRIRDLFPQRICMKVISQDMTDAVLGPGSYAKGARCTDITEVGVGYIFTEFAGAFMRFALPEMKDVVTIAAGKYWKDVKQKTRRRRERTIPCSEYMLYSGQGILLYIGTGFDPVEQITEHKDKPWFSQVDHSRTKIKKYPSEAAAHEAEVHDIENLHPLYNIRFGKDRKAS
jgi:hypothetical protein